MRFTSLSVIAIMICLLISLSACSPGAQKAASEPAGKPAETEKESKSAETDEGQELHLRIGDKDVAVAWENNDSVNALKDLASAGAVSIDMSMYDDFEQVGSLGTSLPRNDEQITAEAGDIMLYSGDQLVVFYGSNSWAYTRLGKIKDKSASELTDLLGNGDVTITISYSN